MTAADSERIKTYKYCLFFGILLPNTSPTSLQRRLYSGDICLGPERFHCIETQHNIKALFLGKYREYFEHWKQSSLKEFLSLKRLKRLL